MKPGYKTTLFHNKYVIGYHTNNRTKVQSFASHHYVYVMCAMQGDKVLSWQLYASSGVDLLCQEQCSWAPTKGGAVLWRWIMEETEQCSQDVSEASKGIDVSQTLTVITTTQTNTIEGSRL